MNKLSKWYHKHHNEHINIEGIWYNKRINLYEAHYYPQNMEMARVIGRYNTLEEAILAKQVYEKAINDVRNVIKQIEIEMEE